MTMRALIWLALLFAAAVAVAVLGRFDMGHVVIVYPPYRIDASLNLVILALLGSFIVMYALLRMLRNVLTMPRRVAAYRGRARAGKAHRALREATGNLFAGRFSRAEKAAREACALPENRDAASLIGAQAAHRMREFARRDEWLGRIAAPDWQEARLMATADLRADAHDGQGALTALGELRAQGARRIHAQHIALRAHQQLKHWAEVLKLVKGLEKRDAIHPALAVRVRQTAVDNLLREHAQDADALVRFWNTLAPDERRAPRTADLAAQLLIGLERRDAARRVVEEALAENWDARLLRRYADCAGPDALPLLQQAEVWQQSHGDDADLLLTLGRLCLRQKLWGKSQAFLEGALKAAGDDDALRVRAHQALAGLHEEIGQPGAAGVHYRASALAMKVR